MSFRSVKGMHDVLPTCTAINQKIELMLANIANRYGYNEIRTPAVEKLELFARTAGASSDLVTKEMYSFTDQNKEVLALRPEGTAPCVRSGIEHNLFYGKKQRLWYIGSMFRRERPQKGRYRQFQQFGLECFGYAENHVEVEIIQIVSDIMSSLNIKSQLEINHLGSSESRINFQREFIEYLTKYYNDLDDDSKFRLEKNPLRIFDSKIQTTQEILKEAPKITNYLSHEEQAQLEFVTNCLLEQNIEYKIAPKLVRGLDYYTGIVFEWQKDGLTLCAGGRYDNLVSDLGGSPTPAVGVALGIERLIDSCQLIQDKKIVISVLCHYPKAFNKASNFAKKLRASGYIVKFEFHASKLKSLLKIANQNESQYVILIGQNEYDSDNITVKNMLTSVQTSYASLTDVIELIQGEENV